MAEASRKNSSKWKSLALYSVGGILLFILVYAVISKLSKDGMSGAVKVLLTFIIIALSTVLIYFFARNRKTLMPRNRKSKIEFGVSMNEIEEALLDKHAGIGDIRYYVDERGKKHYNKNDYHFGSQRFFIEKDGNVFAAKKFSLFNGDNRGHHIIAGLMDDIRNWQQGNYVIHYHNYKFNPDIKLSRQGYSLSQPASPEQKLLEIYERRAETGRNTDPDLWLKEIREMGASKEEPKKTGAAE